VIRRALRGSSDGPRPGGREWHHKYTVSVSWHVMRVVAEGFECVSWWRFRGGFQDIQWGARQQIWGHRKGTEPIKIEPRTSRTQHIPDEAHENEQRVDDGFANLWRRLKDCGSWHRALLVVWFGTSTSRGKQRVSKLLF